MHPRKIHGHKSRYKIFVVTWLTTEKKWTKSCTYPHKNSEISQDTCMIVKYSEVNRICPQYVFLRHEAKKGKTKTNFRVIYTDDHSTIYIHIYIHIHIYVNVYEYICIHVYTHCMHT